MSSTVVASASGDRSAPPVTGSRPWKCTTAAPASTHRAASAAISSGDQGTCGLAARIDASFIRTVMITVAIATPWVGSDPRRGLGVPPRLDPLA